MQTYENDVDVGVLPLSHSGEHILYDMLHWTFLKFSDADASKSIFAHPSFFLAAPCSDLLCGDYKYVVVRSDTAVSDALRCMFRSTL